MIRQKRKKYTLGFTFIELMLVVVLTSFLVLSATSLLLATVLNNGRANSAITIKNNGDYALGQMELLIRNSIDILPNSFGQVCQTGMSEIRLLSLDEGITTYRAEQNDGVWKIASNSGIFLTSDAVTLVANASKGSNYLNFDCYQTADQLNRSVEVSFTLHKGTEGVSPDTEVIDETFQTTTTIRSF